MKITAKATIVLIVTVALTASCNNQFKHPDTGNIDLEINVDYFYKQLFGNTAEPVADKAQRLVQHYGGYFDTYCKYEIRIGQPDTTAEFCNNLQRFLTYDENNEVLSTCDSVVEKLTSLDDQLTDAFKCFRYYFPNTTVPKVYSHFSGFNNKMFVDSTYISFSIEHYLGADCRFYRWLEMPVYARRSKNPENIAPDVVKGWIYASFPDLSKKEDILTAMVYQGKVLYALKKCVPSLPPATLFGFTDDELAWCEKAEADMWSYMAEQKLLYSTNPLDRNKLINEAPFTAFFGDKSPGRAVLYCAFNIVCEYMANTPDATLPDLFAQDNAQTILVESHYRP